PPPPPEEKKEPPKPPPPVKSAAKKPPPLEPPKPLEEAPKPTPPPIVIPGIGMESTIGSGAVSAPVANTAMGAMPTIAPDPNAVQPYKAPRYVPPGGADTDPEVLPGYEKKVPYPPAAKAAGIEGTV